MTKEQIEQAKKLFLMQKDKTRLSGVHCKHRQPDDDRVILPENDYYKYYSKSCKKVIAKVNGHNEKYNKDTQLSVSTDVQHVFGQCVVLKDVLGKNPNSKFFFNVEVATYMEHNGKIVLLNRFDHGTRHKNDLSIYSSCDDGEQKLYEEYFKKDADTTHFHFNTAVQSKILKTQDCANAIGLIELIDYLHNLQKCEDKTAPIYKYNLGMPFLDYKKNLMGYNSQIVQNLQAALKNEPDANMIKAMQEIMRIADDFAAEHFAARGFDKGNKNLQMVAKDFLLVGQIVNKCDKKEYVEIATSSLMNSLSGSEIKKEKDHDREI